MLGLRCRGCSSSYHQLFLLLNRGLLQNSVILFPESGVRDLEVKLPKISLKDGAAIVQVKWCDAPGDAHFIVVASMQGLQVRKDGGRGWYSLLTKQSQALGRGRGSVSQGFAMRVHCMVPHGGRGLHWCTLVAVGVRAYGV